MERKRKKRCATCMWFHEQENQYRDEPDRFCLREPKREDTSPDYTCLHWCPADMIEWEESE